MSSRREPGQATRSARHDFNRTMRTLLEEHVTWTRLMIISVAGELPDRSTTGGRLARSQAKIGETFRPFYGDLAGARIAKLLRDHVSRCVELIETAKTGDTAALVQARAANYLAGDEIARFLTRVNPSNWPRRVIKRPIATIVDLTLVEALARVHGDYFVDVVAYEQLHQEMLAVADLLADGIVSQFPETFASA